MDFNLLRVQARQKRDRAIAIARSECRAAIRHIASAERKVISKGWGILQLTKAVDAVIPTSGTFTIDDLMESLEMRDPGRFWPRKQVISHMRALRNRGLIHSLRLPTTGTPAIYASDMSVVRKATS